jgi:hypothetical protein
MTVAWRGRECSLALTRALREQCCARLGGKSLTTLLVSSWFALGNGWDLVEHAHTPIKSVSMGTGNPPVTCETDRVGSSQQKNRTWNNSSSSN